MYKLNTMVFERNNTVLLAIQRLLVEYSFR